MESENCSFDYCSNKRRRNRKLFTLFSFPREGFVLKRWLEFFNEHNPTKLDKKWVLLNKPKLCHLHFTQEQMVTKANKDRILLRNQVPCCPPGVIDKKHANNILKRTQNIIKNFQSGSSIKQYKLSAVDPITQEKIVEKNCPLYHSISGYMIDLRVAAQQETFRLPNGKLIQVKRQPKKGCSLRAPSKSPIETESTESSQPAVSMSETTAQATENPSVQNPDNSTFTRNQSFKTYTNKRICNQSPETAENVRSIDLYDNHPPQDETQHTETLTSQATEQPTLTARQSPNISQQSGTASESYYQITETVAIPQITPPVLTSIQYLFHKQHEDTTFGNFQKKFENQLISAAEVSLHIVSKVNSLLNSNPYKNAATERDLKDLYVHLSYILKYAIDRFSGLEESCAKDIKSMGFTDQSDLGPILESKTSDEDDDKSEQHETMADDDDDCAIIEQRTDLIEILSDDEGMENMEENEQHTEKSDKEILSVTSPPPSRVARKSSNTESVADCTSEAEHEEQATKEHRTKKQIRESPENEVQSDQQPEPVSEKIEMVVQHEIQETVEITDVVETFYYEQAENEDEIIAMEVQEESSSNSEGQGECKESENEEEELIEIIESEEDLDLDESHDYKIVDVIDDGFYVITHE
ncbi:uncharacterized protein LOC131438065 [Malaya genurostris]|uniref:uncharacterized protein LOC131438065 n=1 Tax=Malaya genurostris TaxID=325434 RepID=UPI0026F3F9B0|nr:uncharacterized protein LOC131438065 [Malaya genurostris]